MQLEQHKTDAWIESKLTAEFHIRTVCRENMSDSQR